MTTEAATWATLAARMSRQMVDVAVAEAAASAVGVTVVVVDESGVLKELCRMDGELCRMDGAPLVSVQTAVNKACVR